MARQSDFLDLYGEQLAALATAGQGHGKAIASNLGGAWDFWSNPNSLERLKLRAEQEGRQLMPGALPPSAAIPGSGPAGNQVGMDYNPNEPGLQGDPNTWSSGHITPGERARESEARRMMQQYASDEYWDTEAGKAMLELGNQERYTGDDLAGFYDAQQAVGTGGIDEIVDAMGYTGDMEAWARANPALALREYQKNSEALPADGYAGYGTGEPQVDERLQDVATYSPVYAPSEVPTSSEVPATAVNQENAASNYSPLGGPFTNVNWLGTGEQAAAEEAANQFARQRVLNFLEASRNYPAGSSI